MPPKRKPSTKAAKETGGANESIATRYAFPPVVGDPVKHPPPVLLILGSAPGEQSLVKQQYYGHPQNHFWRVLGTILEFDSSLPYEERCEIVRQKGVALWDVCHGFKRKGSLDSAITAPILNDFEGFLTQYPSIRLIGCNGGYSGTMFRKHVLKSKAPPAPKKGQNEAKGPNAVLLQAGDLEKPIRVESKQAAGASFLKSSGIPAHIRVVQLPSTSPAHAMKDALIRKTEVWRSVLFAPIMHLLHHRPTASVPVATFSTERKRDNSLADTTEASPFFSNSSSTTGDPAVTTGGKRIGSASSSNTAESNDSSCPSSSSRSSSSDEQISTPLRKRTRIQTGASPAGDNTALDPSSRFSFKRSRVSSRKNDTRTPCIDLADSPAENNGADDSRSNADKESDGEEEEMRKRTLNGKVRIAFHSAS